MKNAKKSQGLIPGTYRKNPCDAINVTKAVTRRDMIVDELKKQDISVMAA